jgi:hypothetical protein
MDKTGIHPGGEHAHVQPHGHAHDDHHEELGFWRKYVFSLDHKVIGPVRDYRPAIPPVSASR